MEKKKKKKMKMKMRMNLIAIHHLIHVHPTLVMEKAIQVVMMGKNLLTLKKVNFWIINIAAMMAELGGED
jgi:hypothetical protein